MAAASPSPRAVRARWLCVACGLVAAALPGCAYLRPPRPPLDRPASIYDSPDSRYPANEYDNDSGRIVGQRSNDEPNGPGQPLLGRRVENVASAEAQPAADGSLSAAAAARISERMMTVSERLKRWFSRNARPAATPPGQAAVEPPIEVALQPPMPLAPEEGSSQRGIPVRRVSQPPPARAALPGPIEAQAAPAPGPETDEPTAPQLVAAAQKRLDGMSSYQVHMTRQERVKDQLLPAEKVVLSIRRNPKAVRLEWAEGSHKGREVIYADDQGEGLMYVHMGDSLVPVPRLSMRPDSPMALAQSRHPITEAGLDTIVAKLQAVVTANARGDESEGKLLYEGLKPTEGLDHPCHTLTRRLPDGERWLVAIDPRTDLPALVEATDANGQLLEHYEFTDLKPDLPELASADAFNPDTRWGQPQRLFGRLARTGNPSAKPAESLQQ